jgi:hypothetical protein
MLARVDGIPGPRVHPGHGYPQFAELTGTRYIRVPGAPGPRLWQGQGTPGTRVPGRPATRLHPSRLVHPGPNYIITRFQDASFLGACAQWTSSLRDRGEGVASESLRCSNKFWAPGPLPREGAAQNTSDSTASQLQ